MKLRCLKNYIEIIPENQVEEIYLDHIVNLHSSCGEARLRQVKNEWARNDPDRGNCDILLTTDKTD